MEFHGVDPVLGNDPKRLEASVRHAIGAHGFFDFFCPSGAGFRRVGVAAVLKFAFARLTYP